ncbi:Battenin [Aphelenchoides besseyi]|nr:Battenin [Aphelenchoides besseyi]
MLSAAVDIINQHGTLAPQTNVTDRTLVFNTQFESQHFACGASIGPLLLADIVPLFLVKCTLPFFMHRLSFGFQHIMAVLMQTLSYLIVAYSENITTSLVGIVLASIESGIGEVCYLALASHYNRHTISSWSSGTGGAGILGALVYAFLTEKNLANFTIKETLLSLLVVPVLFFITYFVILSPSPTVYPIMKLSKPSTWFILDVEKSKLPDSRKSSSSENSNCYGRDGPYLRSANSVVSVDMIGIDSTIRTPSTFTHRVCLMPLLKYMISLCFIYYFQYLISQGLSQFAVFPSDRSFNLDVVSQLGIFFTRSSVSFVQLPVCVLILLPFLQFSNAAAFFFNVLYQFIPNIVIQGLIAGASYANSFYNIHREVDPDVKEFSLSITSASKAIGIAAAGFSSIPLQQFICGFKRS